MPNRPAGIKLPGLALATTLALLTGCAMNPADPSMLAEADDAIELAERAGAEDHAPLELDEARELRAQAAEHVAEDEGAAAARMAARAALQARLAIVRAEGSIARSKLERKRTEFRELKAELESVFGEALNEDDDS